jgi:hypothetical protein
MVLYLISSHGVTSRETWFLAPKSRGVTLSIVQIFLCYTWWFSSVWIDLVKVPLPLNTVLTILIPVHPFVPATSASNYFKVVRSMHFFKSVYSVFISPSKPTILIICKRYKGVSPSCCGTSVPYSGRRGCQFQNHLPMIRCYLEGSSVWRTFQITCTKMFARYAFNIGT